MLKKRFVIFPWLMMGMMIGCRSVHDELNFDELKKQSSSAVAYSGEFRIKSLNFYQALDQIEKTTDLSFVVSPSLMEDAKDGRFDRKQSFRYKTDQDAVNAFQYAFQCHADQRGTYVYLSNEAPELQDNSVIVELCFLTAVTGKALDAAANLQFLNADMLDAAINDLIDIKGDLRYRGSSGWQVSKREITLCKDEVSRISNGIVSYVERSNLSDYGVRSVNGYDERESGDILELQLKENRSRSSLVMIKLEESNFSSSSEKQAIKVDSVQALDEHWRIVADYFRAEKEKSFGIFSYSINNRQRRFIVVARKKQRSFIQDDFLSD